MKYSFIDLFAGIGGFRLGFEMQGNQCVFSSEIDTHARQMYLENFGELPYGDITKIDSNDIPTHDILLACFPCQPFSIAGEKRGFEDARGTLFFDIARILEAKKPKVVVLENVKHFKNHDKGKTLNIVLSILHNLGYTTSWEVLNANASQESAGRYFIYHKGRVRKLTLKECFRLMGFSDNFKFTGSKAKLYNRVGNSVVVPMVKAIAKEIENQILSNKTSNSLPFYSLFDYNNFYNTAKQANTNV